MKKLTAGELAELFTISKYKIRHSIGEQLRKVNHDQFINSDILLIIGTAVTIESIR